MSRRGPRKFKGFAVLAHPNGPLIWGTFRPKAEDARAAYDRHNPAVAGFPSPRVVVPVRVILGRDARE